jgi:hypothetical protein
VSQLNSEDELDTLKVKVSDLLAKHDELLFKIANCKNAIPNRQDMEADLLKYLNKVISTSSANLMTRNEFSAKLAETQELLKYGLESEVLEKVRNDPVILDKMAKLAFHGNKFSKEDVVSIVHEALNVYDADKTGLFDFALESAGGTIASTR